MGTKRTRISLRRILSPSVVDKDKKKLKKKWNKVDEGGYDKYCESNCRGFEKRQNLYVLRRDESPNMNRPELTALIDHRNSQMK